MVASHRQAAAGAYIPGEGGAASVGMRRLAQRAVSAVARRGRGPPRGRPVAPSRGVWHDRRFDLGARPRHPRWPRTTTPRRFRRCARRSPRGRPAHRDRRMRQAPRTTTPGSRVRGATGTGKTRRRQVIDTIARDKPTLVVVPNKTLAAQVAELRAYLRDTHRVELFVSHFSLYVPESFSRGDARRGACRSNLDAPSTPIQQQPACPRTTSTRGWCSSERRTPAVATLAPPSRTPLRAPRPGRAVSHRGVRDNDVVVDSDAGSVGVGSRGYPRV